MSLTERVRVNTRYTRSINVKRDRNSASIIDAYVPTSNTIELLRSVATALDPVDQPRSWSLIGPYGSGKSSFAVFLHALLGNTGSSKSAALRSLASVDSELSGIFVRESCWCRVVLSGNYESLRKQLLIALDEAATDFFKTKRGRKPAVVSQIREALRQREVSDSTLLMLLQNLHCAVQHKGLGGLLIIIDELGKFLEHEVHHGGSGMFLLQQIAELTYHGGSTNLLLFVIVHQGFELYARGVDFKLKNEWAKVQGRFESVSFIETAEQTLRTVASAFTNSLSKKEHTSISKRTSQIANALRDSRMLPRSLNAVDVNQLFLSCYPLHPITLLALPLLCQKYAQNERTLFSYLGSKERYGFLDSLSVLNRVDQWVLPNQIYNYFLLSQPTALIERQGHRRWVEVVSAIERAESISNLPPAVDGDESPSLVLAKTIGILNLISQSEGLKASKSVLQHLFVSESAFIIAIKPLIANSIIQYRRYSDEYRVWQGTDFDIDVRTNIEKEKLGSFDLADICKSRPISAPILARRHSIRTGSLRHFEIQFIDNQSQLPEPLNPTDSPRIVFFLAISENDKITFHESVQKSGNNEIWVLHKNISPIREASGNVLVLENVERNSQELASDPIASREVRERLQTARMRERVLLESLFGDPSSSDWYWSGKKLKTHDHSMFQHSLSEVMDSIYSKTPLVRNELINRDKLSTQAAGARNRLFQHMLSSAEKPGLAIEKYPPEKAIYRSVFEAGRLHMESIDGWKFVRPDSDDPLQLSPFWNRLDELFTKSDASPITLLQIMDIFSKPPFGVKRGLFPVLFVHFYLIYHYEIALYEEDAYCPSLTYEHLERMVRRPDLYSFQRFRIEGVRIGLLEQYSKALFGEIRNPLRLLEIARPLTQLIMDLEEYTKQTKQLSELTTRIRDAFFLSKSPESFFFKELPIACGFQTSMQYQGLSEYLVVALRELKEAHRSLLDDMLDMLKVNTDLHKDLPLRDVRNELSRRLQGLETYPIDSHGLKSFIRRICEPSVTDDEWFKRLLLFLGHKPSTKWNDQDRDIAVYRLVEFARRLKDLQKLHLNSHTQSTSDTRHETIMLKIVSNISGELDEIVTMNDLNTSQFTEAMSKINKILNSMDNNNQAITLIAKLANELLTQRKQPNQSRTIPEHVIS